MDLSQAILLRNSLRENHVIMAYNGTVSDDLMVTLADLLKERLVANDDVKRSKLIFAVPNQVLHTFHKHSKNQFRAFDIVIGHKAFFKQIGQRDHQVV